MEWTSRIWFTARQKTELWERWKGGQCMAAIARTLGRRNKSGVYRILALNGGIVPIPRRRASVALKLEEREEISRGIAAGQSIRQIARSLGRSPSTMSREVRRNGGSQGYRASLADDAPGIRRCALNPVAWRFMRRLRWRVAQKLALAMVAEADRRLAKAAIPNRSGHATLSRNDLSQPLRSDAWRLEEGADGAFADHPANAPGQRRHHQERTGANR